MTVKKLGSERRKKKKKKLGSQWYKGLDWSWVE